jgi:hypothetical protein
MEGHRCIFASFLYEAVSGWAKVVNSARKNPQTGKASRVLDIKPGALTVVIGTVYMEMRLKPNILEDIAREVRNCIAFTRDSKPVADDKSFSNTSLSLLHVQSSYLMTMKSCWKTSLAE